MHKIDKMWTDFPNDRASTPIKRRSSMMTGPRTSTPKLSLSKTSTHRSRKKKKQTLNNDYRLIFYGQPTKYIQKKKHSVVRIWFL